MDFYDDDLIEPACHAESSEAILKTTLNIIKILITSNPRLRPRYDRYDVAVSTRPCSNLVYDPHACIEADEDVCPDFYELSLTDRTCRLPRMLNISSLRWRDSAAAWSDDPQDCEREHPTYCSEEPSFKEQRPALENAGRHDSASRRPHSTSSDSAAELTPLLEACSSSSATTPRRQGSAGEDNTSHHLTSFSTRSGCADARLHLLRQPSAESIARLPLARAVLPPGRRRLWRRLLGCLGA